MKSGIGRFSIILLGCLLVLSVSSVWIAQVRGDERGGTPPPCTPCGDDCCTGKCCSKTVPGSGGSYGTATEPTTLKKCCGHCCKKYYGYCDSIGDACVWNDGGIAECLAASETYGTGLTNGLCTGPLECYSCVDGPGSLCQIQYYCYYDAGCKRGAEACRSYGFMCGSF